MLVPPGFAPLGPGRLILRLKDQLENRITITRH